jgi:pimeloyl-ACP methyl ester carboxylesterase
MRFFTRPLTAGAILGCLSLLVPAGLPAQDKKEEKKDDEKKTYETVRFNTVDQVELKGSYWPSTRGKKGPVAILLHRIGGQSNGDGWKDLAEDLQKAGFAVLSFDFRGHGASINVAPQFWSHPMNQNIPHKLGPKLPETISLADLQKTPGYLPNLVNDIAAAKRYLERRYNDSGECNLSNLVLIGSEDGATLGALWLATETKRYRLTQNLGGPVMKANNPESKDVVACVWLNMSNTLGGKVPATYLNVWLREAGNSQGSKVPMAFIFGKQDEKAEKEALKYVKAIRPMYDPKKPPKDDLRGTFEYGVPETKLVGSKLLTGELSTREDIIKKYFDGFIFDEKKGLNEWENRESEKANYGWYLPSLRMPILSSVPLRVTPQGDKIYPGVPVQSFLR